MDAQEPPAEPPRRSDWGWALLALLVVGAAGGGALVYQHLQGRERAVAGAGDFDLQETTEGPRSTYQPDLPDPSESGLGMLKHGFEKVPALARRQSAQPGAPGNPASAARDLAGRAEKIINAIAMRYTRQHKVIRDYGKEWMSYPDLKKLNDDYFKDRDPVKFMRGLAKSENFPKLVKKYATAGPIQSFVKEAVKAAPSGSVDQAMKVVNEDQVIKGLVDNVGKSLGLPVGMLSGALGSGGSGPPQVDGNAIMSSMMSSNPDMQKAMQNAEVQKALSSPDVQGKLKQQ